MSLPIISDSDSTRNTPRNSFTQLIAGHYHKFYCINGVWHDRNLDANSRQIIYGDAAFDFYLDTLINAGKRVQAQRWAASMIFYALTHPVIAPTPPADAAFCIACGESSDDELCAVCAASQSKIIAFPMTGITAVAAAVPAAQIKPFTPRNARTGREVETVNQKTALDLMAQYPEARHPSEAGDMRMAAYLANKPKPSERQPVAQPHVFKKAAGF